MQGFRLLLRKTARPNLENYYTYVDCLLLSVDGVCSMTVIEIPPGNWFVGVFLNQTEVTPDPFPYIIRANLLSTFPAHNNEASQADFPSLRHVSKSVQWPRFMPA